MSPEEIKPFLKEPESSRLEFKLALPTRSIVAQQIAAFANSEGGLLIIGIDERGAKSGGLTRDSLARTVVEAALLTLSPRPTVDHAFLDVDGVLLYVIKVQQSKEMIVAEGHKLFHRTGGRNVLGSSSASSRSPSTRPLPDFGPLRSLLQTEENIGTESLSKLARQYGSLVRIAQSNLELVCTGGEHVPSSVEHGRTLLRLLFSSLPDSWERYLSDLLFEIYLANPKTLKSNQRYLKFPDQPN